LIEHVDSNILRVIENSPEFNSLRERFANTSPILPSESWVEDGNAYVVYDLTSDIIGLPSSPLVLFVLSTPSMELLLVRLVTPLLDLPDVEVIDLYVK
jgi:hypothetical protein